MQFHSYEFIFLFLPFSVISFFLISRFVSHRAGKILFALNSLLFYSFAGLDCLLLLLISVIANYLFSLLIEKKKKGKAVLIFAVSFHIGILCLFKYSVFFLHILQPLFHADFVLKTVVIPLGISFYTFQQISYLVSVYQKKVSSESFLDYAVYILFFPKLLMGPLTEPKPFMEQLNHEDFYRVNWTNMGQGVQLFIIGLFKKVILAAPLAAAADFGFASAGAVLPHEWIFYALCFTFQIYFDFSGYTDMAKAVARMHNIALPDNFNAPYHGVTLQDFWKRWHMSLTRFFTNYVYIPLGGNRKGKYRTYLNVFIVFFISGLWHGAAWTFILWGVINGLICIFERIFHNSIEKLPVFLKRVITFMMINVLWLLFRSPSIHQWLSIMKKLVYSPVSLVHLLSQQSMAAWLSNFLRLSFSYPVIPILILSAAFLFVPERKMIKKYSNNGFSAVLYSVLLVICILNIASKTVFIYSGF